MMKQMIPHVWMSVINAREIVLRLKNVFLPICVIRRRMTGTRGITSRHDEPSASKSMARLRSQQRKRPAAAMMKV